MPHNYALVAHYTATSDGRYLVASLIPREGLDTTTRPSYLVLSDIATGAIITIRRLPRPQSQVITASSEGDWVVWAEAADQPNFFDWTLLGYNRRTGGVTQLAAAVHQQGHAIPGPYPTPVVSHDHVIWGEAIGPITTDNYDNAVVRLTDLLSGHITTVATRAGLPVLSWPWAAWDQQSSGPNGYMALKNLETGQTTQIAGQPATFVLWGTSAAYDDVQSVSLLDDFTRDSTHPLLLQLVSQLFHLQFVTLNDRIVAWQSDGPPQVYDRLERRLVTLPVATREITAFVSGRLLVWLDEEPPDQQAKEPPNWAAAATILVLDTTTLPTAPPTP